MFSKLLDRLESRIGRHKGIRNLMSLIVAGTVIVFLADYILPMVAGGRTLSSYLSFSKGKIMSGQIWRLLTFVFVPMDRNLVLLAISLYFYWMIGNTLQSEWGTFRFTLFYTTGMLGSVIAGCITGYATAYYLNMSLMLAMAALHPNMPLRLYGFVELRIKWLALLSVVMMVLPLLQSHGWQQPLALIVSLANVLLFFMDRMIGQVKDAYRRYTWKRNWRNGWKR